MEKLFTLSIYTEHRIGILNRITIIFTRRHLNIESTTVSECEIKNVARLTMVIRTTHDQIMKVKAQIEKIIEVIKVFVLEDEDIVHQEIALYKVNMDKMTTGDVEKVVRDNHARILTVDPEFMIIEKTGHFEETQILFEQLKPYGVLGFARSGRVALMKQFKEMPDLA